MKKHYTRRQFVGASTATAFAFNFFPSRVFGANDRIALAGIVGMAAPLGGAFALAGLMCVISLLQSLALRRTVGAEANAG